MASLPGMNAGKIAVRNETKREYERPHFERSIEAAFRNICRAAVPLERQKTPDRLWHNDGKQVQEWIPFRL
jgi:hypothetical protein